MNSIHHEWLLLRRSRTSVLALVLSVWLVDRGGMCRSRRSRSSARTARTSARARKRRRPTHSRHGSRKTGDAGNAAYYSFHPTWNPPSALAFAALGFRDVAPQTLRVRALGLEAQLYENESFNPEMALAGRFDFAFVVIYLAPLFIIALLHDLVSRERETGRLPLLTAISRNIRRVWWARVSIRMALLSVALLAPFAIAAWREGASLTSASAFGAVVFAYLIFWALVVRGVGMLKMSSAAHRRRAGRELGHVDVGAADRRAGDDRARGARRSGHGADARAPPGGACRVGHSRRKTPCRRFSEAIRNGGTRRRSPGSSTGSGIWHSTRSAMSASLRRPGRTAKA